jgi:hypothetical protein
VATAGSIGTTASLEVQSERNEALEPDEPTTTPADEVAAAGPEPAVRQAGLHPKRKRKKSRKRESRKPDRSERTEDMIAD